MNRRDFIAGAGIVSAGIGAGCARLPEGRRPGGGPRFNRPGDAGWPGAEAWAGLRRQVGGRLIAVESPVEACRRASGGGGCGELFARLKNPYDIGDDPALTQTSGWIDAWTSSPSVFAVAAESGEDVAAAVNFARRHRVRLVVKGGGHSYLGTSNAPDSLLVWTRHLNGTEVHDAFTPQGCGAIAAPQPAVTVGAGAIWAQAYRAVTTGRGRYVQGGGCTTVGVAGLIQSGGFGSFSKRYGLAAAGLLEAEVVTADGRVRIVNALRDPELFWGLKGGGGGSLGIVTRLTLRTRELPEFFGGIFGEVRAHSDEAFRKLIARAMVFYREALFNPHWGEQLRFGRDNAMEISMVFQGLNREQAVGAWKPLIDWISASPDDFKFVRELQALQIPARDFWNPDVLKKFGVIRFDNRPGAPSANFLWEGDRGQSGWVIHGYRSAWLPAELLEARGQADLAEAIFNASRHWSLSLHFNKGLAGAPAAEIEAARDTATNPAVLGAFALAIVAAGEGPAFPGIPGHEPNVELGRAHARSVDAAMRELLRPVADAGSYLSETDYFQRSWQQSFWGANHPRLAAAKAKYDPGHHFVVHHGVGSAG